MNLSSCPARHARLVLARLLGAALVPCLWAAPVTADPYDDFARFADEAFGAETEPLVYEWFGGILDLPADWWEFVSESSAAVGFTTNLPARSFVEYGQDGRFDLRTPTSDRHYAVHLHHLAGLRPGAVYSYRAVTIDERGNVVRSSPREIAPTALEDVIRIPDTMPGPPYVLDRPGATYLVTADLTAPGTAFEIEADGVTLDLGGRRVAYDVVPREVTGDWPTYRERAAFGVRSLGPDAMRIVNGTLYQGPGNGAGHPRESVGFNPVLLHEAKSFEVAGVVLEYSGAQLVGLLTSYPSGFNLVHHNVFVDRGRQITYRHGTGSRAMAITGDVGGFHTHHNLVKRTRQSGLDGARIEHNEIYIDSQATNSYGVPALVDDREASDNRIFGTGYHVVGLGWGSNNWWHDNFIHLVGQGPQARFEEYGIQESLNGIRLTQYGGATVPYMNNLVERNLVVITGGACDDEGECTEARGIQYFSDPYVVDNVIRDNTFKVVMAGGVQRGAGIVTQGLFERCADSAPVRYEGNRVIANITNVRLGDNYGQGCNHVFVGNELVRVGEREDYRTFRFGFPIAIVGQEFYDTIYGGGASADAVSFALPGQELTVGWTLTVRALRGAHPVADAAVQFTDLAGRRLASGRTDAAGRFSAPVPAFVRQKDRKRLATPTTVRVVHDGTETTAWIRVEAPVEREVRLDRPSPAGIRATDEGDGRNVRLSWPAAGSWNALEILDLEGTILRRLVIGDDASELIWDRTDEHGARVPAGTCWARLVGAEDESYGRIELGP